MREAVRSDNNGKNSKADGSYSLINVGLIKTRASKDTVIWASRDKTYNKPNDAVRSRTDRKCQVWDRPDVKGEEGCCIDGAT
jgi:hypothetical protein